MNDFRVVSDENKEHIEHLRKEVEVIRSRIEPRDTGHLYTAISVLEHRIEELENGYIRYQDAFFKSVEKNTSNDTRGIRFPS